MIEPPSIVPAQKLCGRPTRSGRPCRQRISDPRFEVACPQHVTDAEAATATTRRTAYEKGHRDGRESVRTVAEFRIERLQERIDQLERATSQLRTTDALGRQIVCVGTHAYAWSGEEPLAVGDQVWLPENWLSRVMHGPGHYRGEVTALGTRYAGSLSQIIGLAEPLTGTP